MATLTIDTDLLAAVIKQHRLLTSTAAYYGYMNGPGPSEHDIVGVALTAAANRYTEAEAKDAVQAAWAAAEVAHRTCRDGL